MDIQDNPAATSAWVRGMTDEQFLDYLDAARREARTYSLEKYLFAEAIRRLEDARSS